MKIPIDANQFKNFAELSRKNGTQEAFIDMAVDWAFEAEKTALRNKRQLDAALEALEILGQFNLGRFNMAEEFNARINFAARELERIREMK